MSGGWRRLVGERLAQQGGTTTTTDTTTMTTASEESGVLVDFIPSIADTPMAQMLVVVFVTLIGAYLSTYVVRLLGRPIAKRFRRESVAQTVLRGVRIGTVLLFTLFGMSLASIEVGDIVLSVTVFSAVLGIVLAPIVGSVINGLFVLADQPYEIGDMIELDNGKRGFVDDITLRYTKMITLDNTFLIIQNSSIRERDVTNFSAEDERTRLSLDVLVTYECDIDAARSLLERSARQCDDVLEGGPDIRIGNGRYPASPRAYINSFADHGILLRLRFWAKKPYKLGTVQSNVQTKVLELKDDLEIEFAYPHQHLIFDETSGRARVALSEESRPPDAADAGDVRDAADATDAGTATGDPGDGNVD